MGFPNVPETSGLKTEWYYDLGPYHWPVKTSSEDVSLWMDRGLMWAYSFNYEESLRCFERAAQCDPSCAMAFWGIAYATGPNYNKAWKFFDKKDQTSSVEKANDALAQASRLAPSARPVEQALIGALAARFPPTDDIPASLDALNGVYADAMRPVYEAHSDDIDVAVLFAEALMCITPRGLWNLDTGKPTGDHTIEARKVIEAGFKLPNGLNHPALCHLYIHLLEMSPYPELALPAADRLRGLVPDASHMLHMPTHIDAAIGDYRRGIECNTQAMAADDIYFTRETSAIFNTIYRVHYICAKLYSALMAGRFADALSAAERLEAVITRDVISVTSPPMADWMESFYGSRAHVLIRFGRWEDILKLEFPADTELYCATTAIFHYAQGLAYSALGRIPEAEAAQAQFEKARALVPPSRLNSVPCKETDVLGVASAMLAGELEYRRGNFDTAFAMLRQAAAREDALTYSDPPPWMQPVRHALGGLLLDQGRLEEAERAFREDLGCAIDFPRRRARLNNVWGLHGLHECLMRCGKTGEAAFLKAPLDVALASADVVVAASCYCRTSAVNGSKCCK